MTGNVYAWVKEVLGREPAEAPVVEFGSLDVNGSIRDLFPEPYTGIDMREGRGVDEVQDITQWEPVRKYRTGVSIDMLEHCRDPFLACEKMHQSLFPGAKFILTAPQTWPLHNEPKDYWRFMEDGITELLTRAGFKDVKTETLEFQPGYLHTAATGVA